MMLRTMADTAAMNLRMATMQLAGMRIPPRVRTIPSLRRRLPVTMISDPPETIVIRHAVQNMDSPVSKAQSAHSQRV